MAEGAGNNAGVYRSVSFRELRERRRGEEDASCAARRGGASRKVSKISGLPTADSSACLPSASPSIRQLSERFSLLRAPGSGASPARKSPQQEEEEGGVGRFQDAKKSHSGTDSDSERRADNSSSSTGKRDYSQVNAALHKSLTTDEEEDVREVPPPCKALRGYRHTHHDFIAPSHTDKWPSVTKIRQLFDDRGSNPLLKTCEGVKAADRRHLQEPSGEAAPLTGRSGSSAKEASELSAQENRERPPAAETSCATDVCSTSTSEHRRCSKDEGVKTEANRVPGRNAPRSSSCPRTARYCGVNSSPCRSPSPSTESQAASKAPRTTRSASDPKPDLQPCATSSWSGFSSLDASSCSSSRQQPTERGRKDRQGVGLPRDSLHSSHSSSKAPAPTTSSAPAPDKAINSCSSTLALSSEPTTVCSALSSRWKLNSADEEEVHTRRGRGHPSDPKSSVTCRGGERAATERGGSCLSRSKNGWWGAKIIGRSSGSEEDSPTSSLGPHCRDTVRRRSLRKKKKVSGAAAAAGRDDYNHHDGESEDSDSDTVLTMDRLERQQNTGESPGRIHRSHSAREHGGHSYKAKVQHWERITSPVTPSTLPGVSRVSKVNIPPFISSPDDSRGSSRYSSTETLKEEDQGSCANRSASVLHRGGAEGGTGGTASSSVSSKTYHGNFTMYRSPSFGHGDNFSRAHIRLRPKLMPAVTPTLNVHQREGGGSSEVRGGEIVGLKKTTWRGDVQSNKKPFSTPNTDIASETMTLLSFLKSGLPGLKVRRTTEGGKSSAVEGSSAYRRGSGSNGGAAPPLGSRPSLKDLTATLRRTKSFTYSDKPTTSARCYLVRGAAKRSSSEQQLDLDDDKAEIRAVLSDREVESDGGGDFRIGPGLKSRNYRLGADDDEVMPTPFQERCVLEARQVIQDICQMCTREDDDDYASVNTSEDKLGDKSLQVKKTSEEKRETGGIREETRQAESENTKEKDKHEQERENSRRQRSGQSMQLEKLNSRGTECWEKPRRQGRGLEGALRKGDSEESMLYDRSVDELSGHESSLTDEGIVTEPETGSSDLLERSFLGSAGVNLGSKLGRDVLVQAVAGWKQSAHEMGSFKPEGAAITENSLSCTNRLSREGLPCSVALPVCMAETDNLLTEVSATACVANAGSEGIHVNSAVSQGSAAGGGGGGFEAPATPSTSRRRRKFSPSGYNNTSSDSSNGSHADSTVTAVGNGESTTVYRSLSDPMPQRRCSVVEEGNNNFSSVDSNLLGSLSVKGGGGGTPEASSTSSMSEYKGSVASDLSVYSDGGLKDDSIQDYSGVIRNIVAEPGAMNRLLTDDHGNGKTPKKKSFSDPSRRSDAPLLSQNDPQFKGQSGSPQPISELDQSGQIPPSSSEPILSEQREELWASESKPAKIQVKISDCSLHSDNPEDEDDVIGHGGEEEVQKFNFDIKLAEVFFPRKVRRPTRKRPNRLASFFPDEDQFEPLELDSEVQEESSNQRKLTSSPPALSLKSKPKPKHVCRASEPAVFIPISPPPQLQPLKEVDRITVQSTVKPPASSKPPGDAAQASEDATAKCILGTQEKNAEARPVRGASDEAQGVPTTSEGPGEVSIESGPQKVGTEDSPLVPAPQRTKPKVVSSEFVFGF